jgi:hypothetical protein
MAFSREVRGRAVPPAETFPLLRLQEKPAILIQNAVNPAGVVGGSSAQPMQ